MVFEGYEQFLMTFGYLAIFILTVARSIGFYVISFPIPQPVIIGSAVVLGMNPFLVGIISGIGSTLGDTLGYLVGYGGGKFLGKKKMKIPKITIKLTKFFKKRGFWIIVLVGLTPLPFDLFGVASGLVKYDFKLFILASLIGKIGGSLLAAYGVFYGIGFFKSYFGTI